MKKTTARKSRVKAGGGIVSESQAAGLSGRVTYKEPGANRVNANSDACIRSLRSRYDNREIGKAEFILSVIDGLGLQQGLSLIALLHERIYDLFLEELRAGTPLSVTLKLFCIDLDSWQLWTAAAKGGARLRREVGQAMALYESAIIRSIWQDYNEGKKRAGVGDARLLAQLASRLRPDTLGLNVKDKPVEESARLQIEVVRPAGVKSKSKVPPPGVTLPIHEEMLKKGKQGLSKKDERTLRHINSIESKVSDLEAEAQRKRDINAAHQRSWQARNPEAGQKIRDDYERRKRAGLSGTPGRKRIHTESEQQESGDKPKDKPIGFIFA